MEHLPPIDPAAASRTQYVESSLSSKDRKALIIKCQIALFSAYRIDQYADADGFKNSLGAVLEGFPDEVIRYVCDPRTGLQRCLKWPPTISEVVEACEEHRAYLHRMRTTKPLTRLSIPYEKPSSNFGKIFVAADHPRYGELIAAWKLQPFALDGRSGVLCPPELLINMGMMKRGAA